MPNIKLSRAFSTCNVISFSQLNNSKSLQVSLPISGRDLNLIKITKKDQLGSFWLMDFQNTTSLVTHYIKLDDKLISEFKEDDIFILIAEFDTNFNCLIDVHANKIPTIKPLTVKKENEEDKTPVVLQTQIKKKVKKVSEKSPEVYDDGSIQTLLFDDIEEDDNEKNNSSNVEFENLLNEVDDSNNNKETSTTASNTPKGGYNGKTKRNVTKKKECTIPRTPRDYTNHLLGKSYIPNPNDNISWRNRTGNYGVGLKARRVRTTGRNFDVYYDVYIYISYFQEIFKTDISFKSTDELEEKFPLAYKKNSKTMVLSIFIPEELRDIKIKEDIKNGKISEGSGAFAQITLSSLKTCMTKAYNKLLELG